MANTFMEMSVTEDESLSMPKQTNILVAEDDCELRKLLTWSLRRENYTVTECADGMGLLSHLDSFLFLGETNEFDLIISDIRMPGITGIEILEGLHSIEYFPPVILITAFGDEETHAQAQRLGAAAFFDKPFEIEHLLVKIREILFRRVPSESKRSLSIKKGKTPLKFPLNIIFRHVTKSQQIVDYVRSNAAKLNSLSHEVGSCRVVIDKPHHHHKHGNEYLVRITLTVSGQELVSGHHSWKGTSHKNLSVAISDAFDAMRHQLRIFLDKQRTHRN